MIRPPAAALLGVSVRLGHGPGSHLALDSVDLTISAGERVCLIGRSGAGKSSLARCLAGWTPVTAGEVRRAGRVLLLPQDSPRSLNPRWTLAAILAEPLLLARRSASEDLLIAAMEQAGLPRDLLPRRPWQLSSGQRQRAALARILLAAPCSLLVLDEPFAGQDEDLQRSLMRIVLEFAEKQGCAVLFVTHALPWVRRFAQRIVTLSFGRIVEDRSGPDPLAALSHPASLALLAAALPGALEDAG
jgi:ABC-type dipeptide/oligopeptide/nickel transport system ATPase subunit